MRVAMLGPRSQRRGADLFSRTLANALRGEGNEVLEIYLYPPDSEHSLPPSSMECCLDADERRWTERWIGWDFTLARRLRSTLRDFGPDVVQASGGRTVKYAARLASRLRPQPLVVYRNIGEPGVWVQGWRRRLLYSRLVFPRITAVASVGEPFLDQLKSNCPNANPVRCIRRGIDPKELEPSSDRSEVRDQLATDSAASVVLFAGKLSVEKRVDRLLRVFRAVVSTLPDSMLWIAGDGPLAAQLEAQVEALELSDSVRFLGLRSDIGDLLGAADVVALSSDTEGVPGILREAACAGRPAVATRAGATVESIEDGETGLLVDKEDEDGFARALVELLSDAPRRAKLGRAARRRFEGLNHPPEAAANAFLELYRDGLRALGREVPR